MSAGQHRHKDDSTQFNEEETAIGLKDNERMSGMSCANCEKKWSRDHHAGCNACTRCVKRDCESSNITQTTFIFIINNSAFLVRRSVTTQW